MYTDLEEFYIVYKEKTGHFSRAIVKAATIMAAIINFYKEHPELDGGAVESVFKRKFV